VTTPAWIDYLCFSINLLISNSIAKYGSCNIFLTGGRTAFRFYSIWSHFFINSRYDYLGVNFYFGDERCVSPSHPSSNYHLVMGALFPKGVPPGVKVFRIKADHPDLEFVADCYSELLPARIDLILLSVGDDGHIASLFPFSAALSEKRKKVIPVLDSGAEYSRLTITSPVILQASNVFVLAIGKRKRAVYDEAILSKSDFQSLPARLVLDKVWFFGDE